ncbi:MAG: hypothetical protein HYV45_02620 [Candidatus Moranbacteria bacterium]|nr:hypothetical protein [Candidatus Moranbacteria bacterium]
MNKQEIIKHTIYFPMLVSEEGTADLMPPDNERALWKKFKGLSKEIRDILISDELPYKVEEIQEFFRLNDTAIGYVSLFIRKIFFGELSPEQAEAKIGSVLVTMGGDPHQAREIAEFIRTEIMTIKPKLKSEEDEQEEKPQIVAVSLPLLQAMAQYEMLGQQTITMEKIKLKTQRTPVRPSLVNWIKYYRDELGVGHHDSVQRGNFLFRSENGKKLSSEDREHVNFVLKSIEENFPLTIDTVRQEIVFPPFEESFSASAKSFLPLKKEVGEEKDVHFTFSPVRRAGEETVVPLPPKKAFPNHTEGDIVMQRGTAFPVVPRKDLASPVAPPVASPPLGGGISFSTKHILPAEKEMTEKIISPTPKKAIPFSGNGPFRITALSSERQGSFEEGDL